ncbi:hypothetical protein [Jannaschia sp. M317]|uniref:hypothetical protein n=1 Tax=Jannaschia sp. M317 TaxID=2867011 RepID=UPI0021A5EA08|nr:hypothetical protein [Jannaschia sp. M317]UWQ19794.1 hypothetical protein K3551_18635 [Jannaschia sp. M317]
MTDDMMTSALRPAPGSPEVLAAMEARMAEMRERERRERREDRARLLADLRALGATALKAEYDGYGDSGNVEAITTVPDLPKIDAIPGLADFLWSVAYAEHPGFENNEGGGGTVTWDLVADRIDLDHFDNVVDRVHSQSEDI